MRKDDWKLLHNKFGWEHMTLVTKNTKTVIFSLHPGEKKNASFYEGQQKPSLQCQKTKLQGRPGIISTGTVG